jgi:hypothetical protein
VAADSTTAAAQRSSRKARLAVLVAVALGGSHRGVGPVAMRGGSHGGTELTVGVRRCGTRDVERLAAQAAHSVEAGRAALRRAGASVDRLSAVVDGSPSAH